MPAGKGKYQMISANSHYNHYYAQPSAITHQHHRAKHHHQRQVQPIPQQTIINVTGNDVLCGRGVNIAHHPGNERFRTLVTSRHDDSYCISYSASEKRAVAEEIIRHIRSLNPPGRFLKRDGRGQVSRGLNGPWEELSDKEAIKKTCQALRDCNRNDREGYACGVVPPTDVLVSMKQRASTGMSGKQQAAAAAAISAAAAAAAASANLKRSREQQHYPPAPIHHPTFINAVDTTGRLSPSVESAAEWLKKQRTEDSFTQLSSDGLLAPPPLPSATDHQNIYDTQEFHAWTSHEPPPSQIENISSPQAIIVPSKDHVTDFNTLHDTDNVLLQPSEIQPTPVIGTISSHPDIPISTNTLDPPNSVVDLIHDNVLDIHNHHDAPLDASKLMINLPLKGDDMLHTYSNVVVADNPPSPVQLNVELYHSVYSRHPESHSVEP